MEGHNETLMKPKLPSCNELLDIWSREGKNALTSYLVTVHALPHPRTAWRTFQRTCIYSYSKKILGHIPKSAADYEKLKRRFKRDWERTPIV